MVSERMRRQIDRLLDDAEAALNAREWHAVAEAARAVLALEPDNADALGFLAMAGGASAPLRASPGSPTNIEAREAAEVAEAAPAPIDTARIAELAAAAERSGNPLDRLEEGVFVGRARELDRLRSALDEALGGRGSLVMLVGEPGIGKTRTTQELETYARSRGAKVLWGRAHESAGAPPYWPWVQAARAYREQTPDEERRRQYQPYATELQRIFPGLHELFPHLPPPPDTDSEEGKFRLYDALSGFLRSVSAEAPLVVVLDDLHWADSASLGMLTHLTRELGRARVLVLGTYRDTDLDRRHPLSQALGEMNRESLFSRIALRGLAESEVGDYLRRTAGIEPERALIHRIYEETEGNPFFLAQVVNLMAQEGTLTAGATTDVAIPEGVKEALGRRLDRLSEEANALLATLAVAGRDFDHALAQALAEHDDDTTLRLIEEALRARVIEETGAGRYRFTHALMQETLVAELSAARQVQLHGRIAQSIEALHGADDAEHLAELALHYRESAVLNREHASRAAHYAWLAGQQASAQFAWAEAAAHYEACLAQLDAAGAEAAEIDRAELMLRLGVAHRSLADWRGAWRSFMQAVEQFRNRADPIGFARTAIEAAMMIVPAARLAGILEEAAEGVEALDDGLWARLIGAIANNVLGTNGTVGVTLPPDYTELHVRALRVAETRSDDRATGMLLHVQAIRDADAYRLESALDAKTRADALLVRAGSQRPSGINRSSLLTALGHVDEALHQLEREFSLYNTRGARLARDTAQGGIATVALARSQLNVIDEMADDLRLSSGAFTRLWYSLRLLLGDDTAGAIDSLPAVSMVGGVPVFEARLHSVRAHVFAASGREQEAAVEIDGWRRAVAAIGLLSRPTPTYGTLGAAFSGFGGPPLRLLNEQELSWMYSALASGPIAGVQSLNGLFRGIDTLRGELALRFDEVDEAERWFRHGVEFGERHGLMLEVGCCLQGLAEVAERRGNRIEALQHLDAAAMIFAKHGVKLYLDQVTAKQAELGA